MMQELRKLKSTNEDLVRANEQLKLENEKLKLGNEELARATLNTSRKEECGTQERELLKEQLVKCMHQIAELNKQHHYLDNVDNAKLQYAIDELHDEIREKKDIINDLGSQTVALQSQIDVLEATIAAAAFAELTAENVTTPATPKHVPNDGEQQVFWLVPGAGEHHVKHASLECMFTKGKEVTETLANDPRRVCKLCTRILALEASI